MFQPQSLLEVKFDYHYYFIHTTMAPTDYKMLLMIYKALSLNHSPNEHLVCYDIMIVISRVVIAM